MKIAICGSMSHSKKMVEAEEKLLKLGHQIILPKFTREYAKMERVDKIHTESARNKVEHDLIKDYFHEIKRADAILVINEEKQGISNYIGGNSLIEMAFAHVLDKPIFLLNQIPKMNYSDEIKAMKPIALNGNLNLIKD